MNTQNNRYLNLGMVILLVMLLSLVFPASIVFADDAMPPEDSAEVVDTPVEEEDVDQEPPPEEPVDQEPPAEEPKDQEPAPEEAVVEESASDELVSGVVTGTEEEPVIAQIPDDIEIVVLDEQGEAVPLASQEAAEILAVPDPQFCPTGVLPGDPTCGPIRTTIQAAVDDAKAAGVAGTVYIQSGTYNETVTIADFTNALTLQGVVGLTPYTVLTDPADRPVVDGRILIQDGTDFGNVGNTANITLADLIINDSNTSFGDNPAIYANRNTADLIFVNLDLNAPGSGNSGLIVDNHSGNVFLTNVDASGTADIGADIDNTSGSGNVTVTGSTFSQNNGDGLYVRSEGVITLVEVTANQNGDDGADLNNDQGSSTSNIEVVKSVFNNNNDDGLNAVSDGDITLINVTAQDNRGDGVDLDFPTFRTHTATICGGVLSGQSGGGDYNLELTDADIRNTNLTPNNWNPSNGWGTALCDYLDTDSDQVPDQWDTDDDNDGVLDTADQCANTPAGEAVDANGCPLLPPATGGGGSTTGGGGSGNSRGSTSQTIPVTGGQLTDSICTPSTTVLQMASFEVIFADLCGYDTRLGEAPETGLPGSLSDGAQYVSGLVATLIQNGEVILPLPTGASLTVLFKIPSGMEDESFSILRWGGSKWVEESVTVEDGYVKATSSNTGVFVLVVK